MERQLRHHDLRVRIAQTVDGALLALRQERFMAVVLDDLVAGEGSWPVLACATALEPPPPVIMITGSGDARLAAKAVEHGVAAFLPKSDLVWACLPTFIEQASRLAELRLASARLASVVESSRDLIVGAASSGQVLTWNRGAAELLGYAQEEAVGRSLLDFAAPAEREHLQTLIAEAMGRGSARAQAVTLQSKWGEARPVSLTLSHVRASGGGRPVGLAVVAQDQREHLAAAKRLEETRRHLLEVQRLESIGRLAGGVAHDFNNVLMIIRGLVTLLEREGPGSPSADQWLSGIARATVRGGDLTRQLLGFARRTVRRPAVQSLAPVVREATSLLAKTLAESIQLDVLLPPDLWAVEVDGTQILQVLVNLGLNARDAMPGGGRLTFSLANAMLDMATARRLRLDDARYLRLEVADTGTGIAPELMDRIFEPFFTTKDVGQGTGLGLAMVYGIVEAHHGAIDVVSEVGSGTTFTIFLPALPFVAPPCAPGKEAEGVREPALAGRTILVVEDDHDVRAVVADILRQQGARLVFAADGVAALTVYESNRGKLDLVLLDVGLPRMSGIEVFRELQRRSAPQPVVLMTGHGENQEVAALLKTGNHVGYLAKPFDFEEMVERLVTSLAGPSP